MPRLVAQSPEFEGKSFDLSGAEITIGRIDDNKVQIEHASVSGHHAILRLDILRLGNIELLYDSEHQPPGQPMPTLSERINLAECNTHGRPVDFVNASPVIKRPKGAPNKMWTSILGVLALLAVGGIGYFVWTVFFTTPAAT